MTRIPYPQTETDGATRAAADAVARARDGRVLNLYRMMLHSPPLATAWLGLGTHLRHHGRLDARTRELVTCHVATRTGSTYELHHHVGLARNAGVSAEQLEALWHWDLSSCFDARDRLLLSYVDATLGGTVEPDQVEGLRSHLDDAEIVEVTALTAYYLAVSRFLQALAVDIEDSGCDGG